MIDFKKFSRGLFGGSIVLLLTINLFNLLNYAFHFSMVRMLTTSDYAALVALMSILYIFNVSTETIQTIITRYSSKEKNKRKIKNILNKSLRKGGKISLLFFGIYLIAAILIGKFLKIEYNLMALTGLVIFGFVFTPITRGVLQGMKRFNSLGANMVIEGLIKVFVGVFLVYLGWRTYGAMLAVFLSIILAFLFSLISLRDVTKEKETAAPGTSGIYGYGLPVFVTITTIMVFYSLDVILAKALFSDSVAGQYAIASILAKAIFFGTQPVSKAMFPISSGSGKNKKTSRDVFVKSVLILCTLIAIALLIFGFFPSFMIWIFSGEYHAPAISILIYVAVAMAIISLTNLVLFYKLSLGRIKNYLYLPLILVIEVLMLLKFSSNILEYSVTLIFLNTLFLFVSIFLIKNK